MSRKLLWGIVAAAVILGAGVLMGPLNTYFRSAIVGPDVNRNYRPLVRHQKSQVHCYDNGSSFCESRKLPFEKEFTVGYLLAAGSKPIDSVKTQLLYSCANQKAGRFHVTLNQAECGKENGYATTKALGQLFTEPTIETPAAVYRCFNADHTDALVTDDPQECSLVGYDEPETLGYVAAAGYLWQRRLEDLCASVSKACAQGGASAGLCQERRAFCVPPVPPSPKPSPISTVSPVPTGS